MTAQELINKAVKCYDDYPNISDYGTDDLDDVTTINAECIRNQIGIKPTIYVYEFDDTEYYTPSDSDFKPVPLPDDLTEDSQIVAVDIQGAYSKTEEHESALYLLVPVNYFGDVTITYLPKATEFVTMTDAIQISDDAANTVARFMLAELLSLRHRKSFSDKMATKARMARAEWRGRQYNFGEVQDYYGF